MITQTFDEVFTFETIYRAHLRGRLAKRDKLPLVRFEASLLENVYQIYKSLSDGTFKFSKYNHFVIYEPKKREIQTLRYCDRIVQHVLCDDVLQPYFSKRAILDNAVCQVGKGTHFALERFENMLRNHIKKNGVTGYFLKCDILKYFPSVPHEELKRVFCSQFADTKLKNLLAYVIDSYHTNADYLAKYGFDCLTPDPDRSGRGIPIGNQTSQVFGMFYLNKVDRLVKERLRIKVYSRYMDDFVLVHSDKEYLRYALSEIGKIITSLGLKFNSKTQICPLKNGITYLGFRFRITPQGKLVKTVKKQTKQRLRWRARLLKKASLDGTIQPERVRQSLAAFHGHLKHAMSYKLEKELFLKLKAYAEADGVVRAYK